MNTSPQVFQESAAVYDLLYGEKDTLGEAQWIATTLESHGCPPAGRLLEFGSGTGRHARILADRGYKSPVWNQAPTCLSELNPTRG